MHHLVVVFIFKFCQVFFYTFYAFRAQMVTAKKLFSIQVCICSIEPVFFKVAAEEGVYAAEQSGPQSFILWWDFMSTSVVKSVGPKVSQGWGWDHLEEKEEPVQRVCWRVQKAVE